MRGFRESQVQSDKGFRGCFFRSFRENRVGSLAPDVDVSASDFYIKGLRGVDYGDNGVGLGARDDGEGDRSGREGRRRRSSLERPLLPLPVMSRRPEVEFPPLLRQLPSEQDRDPDVVERVRDGAEHRA